jgi:hypothetical protein
MTERQYNSKLLGDKLSQLPVPPNEALWSRIEAQLLVVSKVTPEPPAKALLKPGKAVLVKTTTAIVSAILLTMFIVWLVNRRAPQPQPTPAVQPARQPAAMDSTRPDTALPSPVKPVSVENSVVKPTPQSPPIDTPTYEAPLLPRRSTVNVPLRDSVPSFTTPAAAITRADSVKLPPKKQDDGYYFEVKKKKG